MPAFKKSKKTGTSPQGFSQKAWDKLSVEWRDGAQSKKTEELKQDIVKSAQVIHDQRKDMKADPKLQAAVDDVKALRGGYMDVVGGEQAKIDYALYLMTTRGTTA